MYSFHPSENEPVKTDVAVVGGGPAGCFAAVACALTGARTMLMEKNGVLGGTAVAAGVNFPGLFHAWGKQIIDGPCWKAILRARELGGASIPKIVHSPEHHWEEQILINRFVYAYVLDEACRKSSVAVRLHTMVSGAEEQDGRVLLLTAGKEGVRLVSAKRAVDATGDADLAGIMGYARQKSQTLQPATLIHDLGGYDFNALDEGALNGYVAQAFRTHELFPEDFQGGTLLDSLKNKRINMHVSMRNGASSEDRTKVEMDARCSLMRIRNALRKMPGLENLQIVNFSDECGVRETYRIIGRKTITKEDYLNGKRYSDAICYSFYPIDRHVPTGIEQAFLKDGVVPTIPYGALVPEGSKRLLAAGRCISGDAEANSAYRVQASCMADGQAAGVAAALSALGNVPVGEVAYQKLCAGLTALGAIVPTPQNS